MTMYMGKSKKVLKERKHLEVPLRNKDLLSVSSFISYCKKNNVETSKKELEFFDKMNLLIPAIAVNHPIQELKRVYAKFDGAADCEWRHVHACDIEEFSPEKIEEKSVFRAGGISIKRPDLYETFNCASVEYRPWNTMAGKVQADNPKDVESVSLCYSKFQIYPLKFIKDRRIMQIKNAALYDEPETWREKGEKIQDYFNNTASDDYLRGHVHDFYRFLKFYYAAHTVQNEAGVKLNEYWDKRYKEYLRAEVKERRMKKKDVTEHVKKVARSEADKDARAHLKVKIKPRVKKQLLKLLKENDLTEKDIENWRYRMSRLGSLSVKNIPSVLLQELDDSLIVKTQEVYLHVLLVGEIMELLGVEKRDLKELLSAYYPRLCPYCKKEELGFARKTCGGKTCQALHRKKSITKKRKDGIYAPR